MNAKGNPPGGMTPADAKFLFGDVVDEGGWNEVLPRAFKRALWDSGAAKVLAELGLNVDELPDDGVVVSFLPDWAKDVSAGFDLVTVLTQRFAEKRADDESYEKATDRWRKVPDRVKGYIPADVGSWRWTMMAEEIMRPSDLSGREDSPVDIHRRIIAGLGAAYAYMGTPFFIPASRVVDVVTAMPPSPSQREDIRLPRRYVTVFHDGVPISLLAGTDDEIDAFEEGNRIMRDDSLIIGGMLAANDDMTLDVNLGFLVIAAPGSGGYGWRPIPVPVDISSPASGVLWNYAALLAWEGWTVPPGPPEARGKAKSRGYYRNLARSPEGEQGGHHGTWVLDYRPPTPRELKEPTGETRRKLKYRQERSAYWKPRVRYGTRDEHDRLVGPVYGPDAIEGVTFERRGKLIPRSTVRGDLPERPKDEKVYRFPRTIRKLQA